MLFYQYCEMKLASNIKLPELPPATQGKGRFVFCFQSQTTPLADPDWIHHWSSPSGELVLSYGKQDFCHWLRFPGLADFRISANIHEIVCFPLVEIPLETIQHLLLDQVLPRCLVQQGMLMLHASAVELESGGLIFIGNSGSGKSTLAGNFHQAGQPVLADDCVRIVESPGAVRAVPTYGGLRLWEDSLNVLFTLGQENKSLAHYSAKKRVVLDRNDQVGMRGGIPILSVVVLAPPDSRPGEPPVSLDRLSFREVFIHLLKQTFQLDVRNPDKIGWLVHSLGRIAVRLPTYQLRMPRDYTLLELVRQKILEKVM